MFLVGFVLGGLAGIVIEAILVVGSNKNGKRKNAGTN